MTTAPLHPSLPPKPSSSVTELSQAPAQSSAPAPGALLGDDQPEASSSSAPPPPRCAVCKNALAKYTCPGCAMKTCSAPCSGAHKVQTGCTGTRNKAAYVPMNAFTWGKMMDDYTFLEDMGRKVGDYGREIVQGGYMASSAGSGRGRGRGDARGRGGRGSTRGGPGGRGGAGPPKTKRDILKMQLEIRDIDMDLLPVGMERRKHNQSTWDFKNQTGLLTVEYKFNKPLDPLAPSSQPPEPPFSLLTHRNDIKLSLFDLLRSHIAEHATSKKDATFPDWVRRMIYPDSDDPESFTNPQCVMAAHLDPLTLRKTRTKKAHYSLDPTQPLGKVLKHTHFVEYPTIEIWEEFKGAIVDAQGVMQQEEERPAKRQKLNVKAGKQAIAGLLADYGSDDEEEEGGDAPKPQNGLAALGEYAASDGEEEEGGEGAGVDQNAALAEFSDDEGEVEVDPKVLMELMRAAGARNWNAEEEDEAVDWGEDGE